MPKYALVIAEKPNRPYLGWSYEDMEHNWNHLLTAATEPLQGALDALRVGAGAWQLPLATHLSTLADLLLWCRHCKFPCRVLFLEAEPEWVRQEPPK